MGSKKHSHYRPEMDDHTWGIICRDADRYWSKRMLKRFCAHAGCTQVVNIDQRYCAIHQAEHEQAKKEAEKQYDRHRDSPSKRGYDDKWERLRNYKLSVDPLCEDCLEEYPQRFTPATEVHHMQKVAEHPELRLVLSNLRSLCHSCHSKRTARGE